MTKGIDNEFEEGITFSLTASSKTVCTCSGRVQPLLAHAGGAAPQFSDVAVGVEVESDDVDPLELSLGGSGTAFSPWVVFCYLGNHELGDLLLPQIRHRPSLRRHFSLSRQQVPI